MIAGFLLAAMLQGTEPQHNEVAFYISAHQDDWQLFMGADAFRDINDFDEKKPEANGKKVVIIYTTAGDLHDDDDSKTCDCKDAHNPAHDHIPYWQVRESGARNSIHLAACRIGGWGSALPYPDYTVATINGHNIARYEFRNTVSYFLRTKAGQYGHWYNDDTLTIGTIDTSAIYHGAADLSSTIYAIYRKEMASTVLPAQATFHFPDTNEKINIADHNDHIVAGRAAANAAKMLTDTTKECYKQYLYVDYNTKNLPPNLKSPDVQNEAAITAVYCLALLDYNAWPEWGDIYQVWSSRNYYRVVSTCPASTRTTKPNRQPKRGPSHK
jgi:hypothetical protein